MSNEALYPYIFHEDLYVFPPKGKTGAASSASASEEAQPVQQEKPVAKTALKESTDAVQPLKTLHPGQSSALCVVLWSTEQSLQPDHRELLHKILQACKLNPADIGILYAPPAEGLLFTDQLPAGKALVFGDVETLKKAAQAQLPLYQTQTVSGKQLLFSDALPLLAQQTALKANLWKALQQLMGI